MFCEGVGYLLESVTIDLSEFSLDLTKALGSKTLNCFFCLKLFLYIALFLIGQLLSKDDSLQSQAAEVFGSLARQCSSNEAILAMLKHLFQILNGAEGKLSTAQQKCHVLASIGHCAQNSSTQLSHDLVGALLNLFGEHLRADAAASPHEPTVLCELRQLDTWLRQLKLGGAAWPADAQKRLNDTFKALLESKAYTPLTRAAIYHCMANVYSQHGSLVAQAVQTFAPICLQTVEKVCGGSAPTAAQNNALTAEALQVALVLAIFLANDISHGNTKINYYMTY